MLTSLSIFSYIHFVKNIRFFINIKLLCEYIYSMKLVFHFYFSPLGVFFTRLHFSSFKSLGSFSDDLVLAQHHIAYHPELRAFLDMAS